MYYWRQKSFESLAPLQARLGEYPELAEYVQYLDYLQQGLRKQALIEIDKLVPKLNSLDLKRRRELASVLYWETEDESGHRLIPYPLKEGFTKPVINEWKASELNEAEPLRWTGSLYDLMKALELDSTCNDTRRRLMMRIISCVRYATHELPYGYLGDIEEDENLLLLAESELAKFDASQSKTDWVGCLKELTDSIAEYKNRLEK